MLFISFHLLIVSLIAQNCPNTALQRCICTTFTSAPYCPCSAITSSSSLNFASTYNSRLIFVSNMGCRPCPSSCQTCTSMTVCTSCLSSFSLAGTLCIPCPVNCQICSNGICTVCISGYYLDSQTNCQTCPIVGTLICTINSLISCQSNYWLDNNAANCIKCDINCQQCSSTTTCSVCNSGYYLNSSYKCVACMNICSSCSTGSTCSSCNVSGTFFSGSSCISGSIPGCTSYFSSSRCQICNSSFWLNGSTCSIIPNESLVVNCISYSVSFGSIICSNCSMGYFNYSTSRCLWGCSNLCTSCFGPHYGLCFGCVSNAYLFNYQCIPLYNLNQGATSQLLYTAFNSPSLFLGASLTFPFSCVRQYTVGGISITFYLQNLRSYMVNLQWKIYLYPYVPSVNYSVQFNNSQYQVIQSFFPFYCQNNTCNNCVDKQSINITNLVNNNSLLFFRNDNITIAISELLVISSLCGGVQGNACLQCTSITTCTKCVNPNHYILASTCVASCPNSYYVRPAIRTCLSSCPLGTYLVTQIQHCAQCISPCLTCASDLICQSCVNDTYLYKTNCLSVCPDGYYPHDLRRTCDECLRPCSNCISNVQCLSCAYGFYQQSTLTCVISCSSGYYGNIETLKCEVCLAPCLTCSTTVGNRCFSCLTNYYLFGTQCHSSCPSGYYINQHACQICDPICRTCLVSPTNCTSCFLGTYYLNFTCLLSCPASFYNHIINFKCQACPSLCASCLNSLVCTTCFAAAYFYSRNYSCVSLCPDYYYNSTNRCLPCVAPCSKCTSPTICLSCATNFLSGTTCKSSCPAGSYINTVQMKCFECNVTMCLECSGESFKCTKCANSLILFDNWCLFECPMAYYLSPLNTCLNCKQTCASCVNFSYCSSCRSDFTLQNGVCLVSCLKSYYKSFNNSYYCLSCPFNCTTCSSNNLSIICTACMTNYILNQLSCLLDCPAGLFGYKGKCLPCLSPCLACSSQTVCISCDPAYGFYSNGNCLVSCSSGFYPDLSSLSCVKCGSCLTCLNLTYCLSCISTSFLSNNLCQSKCPFGQYSIGNICYLCSINCQSCQNTGSNCTSCTTPRILLNNQCIVSCSPGMYQSNLSCLKCAFPCLTCFNFTHCQSCSSSYYLNSSFKCVQSCLPGYFGFSGFCRACQFPCLTCSSYRVCLSCVSGYLVNGQCQSNCPQSTFRSNSSCLSCSDNCSQCSKAEVCFQCSEGNLLINGTCQQTCPQGYYQYYSICAPCFYGCLNCISSSLCTQCFIGFLFNGACIDICPNGWVSSSNQTWPVCQKCVGGCLKCVFNPTQCTLCQSGLLLYVFSCIMSCPNGTYNEYSSGSCQTCQLPCETCPNGHSCTTCIYGYILYSEQSGNQCILGPYCPNSFYLNMEINICQYECPSHLYIQPIHQTCSSTCPSKYVLYPLNKTCLFKCPVGHWINPQLVCQSNPPPTSLPYMNCKDIVVRNLFIVECAFTSSISNLDRLTIANFSINEVNIYQLYAISSSKVRLVCSMPLQVIRTDFLSVILTTPYLLTSKVELGNTSALNEPQRLLSSAVYLIPVQNIEARFYVSSYFSYTADQRETGLHLLQISQSICIGAFIFWVFALLKNSKSTSLAFVSLLQWCYAISLLDITFPPNLGQFLEGFKVSNLFFNVSKLNMNNLWEIPFLNRPAFWGTMNLFDFKVVILPSLCLFLLFLLAFLTVLYNFTKNKPEQESGEQENQMKIIHKQRSQSNESSEKTEIDKSQEVKPGEQIENKKQQSQQKTECHESLEQRIRKFKKWKILHHRFYFNYWLHLLLLTASPLSIALCLQLVNSNPLAFAFSIIISLTYMIVFVFFARYACSEAKLFTSTKYCFIIFIETLGQSTLSTLSTTQMFIGVFVLAYLINIYIWNRLFNSSKSNQSKNFYQMTDLLRIVILVQILIGYSNSNRWDVGIFYSFGWIVIATIIILIIFVAAHTTKQFFDVEEGSKLKYIKEEQASIKKQQEIIQENQYNKDNRQFAKIVQNYSSHQQDDTELLDFFTVQSMVESDSDNDIIDFDQNYIQAREIPTQLIKIEKQINY